MSRFRSRPREITAERFVHRGAPVPAGVCYGQRGLCESIDCNALRGIPHVHTMHAGQAVLLQDGDWVAPEPDGTHFYPIKPEAMEKNYELISEA